MIEVVKGFKTKTIGSRLTFFCKKHSEYMNCLHLNKTYLTIKKF